MFSAYRPDIVKRPPKTWEEVIELAKESRNWKIAIPLDSVHSLCVFLTLLSNYGEHPLYHRNYLANEDLMIKILQYLSNLIKYIHEDSLKMNPILALEKMSESDEIGYIPLIFGYVNYSIKQIKKKVIFFDNIPSAGLGPIGSVLGGAGFTVSNYLKTN